MNKEITISASGLKTYLNCPARYYHSRMYKPRIFKPYLSIGTLVHEALYKRYYDDISYSDLSDWVDEQAKVKLEEQKFMLETVNYDDLVFNLEKACAIAKGIIGLNPLGHFHYLSSSLEKQFKYRLFTIRDYTIYYKGTIDGIIEHDDDPILFEYKTTSNISDYVNNTYIKNQLQTALYYKIINEHYRDFGLSKPIIGVKYFVFKTPAIRLKQNEAKTSYYARIIAEYLTKRDAYFYESDIVTPSASITSNYLYAIMDRFVYNYERMFPMNPIACINRGMRCDFIPLCYQHTGANKLFIKKEKN